MNDYMSGGEGFIDYKTREVGSLDQVSSFHKFDTSQSFIKDSSTFPSSSTLNERIASVLSPMNFTTSSLHCPAMTQRNEPETPQASDVAQHCMKLNENPDPFEQDMGTS